MDWGTNPYNTVTKLLLSPQNGSDIQKYNWLQFLLWPSPTGVYLLLTSTNTYNMVTKLLLSGQNGSYILEYSWLQYILGLSPTDVYLLLESYR